MRRALAVVAILVSAVVAPARQALAQSVGGRLTDPEGRPLPNGIVSLLDSMRTPVRGPGAAALTDADGAFRIVAPAPGRWYVRAERVGSAGALVGPLALGGDTTLAPIALRGALALGAIRVTARERCRIRPDDGSRTAAIWNDVRQALAGTEAALADSDFVFSLERFQRTRAPYGSRVHHEERVVDPSARRLFEAVPADELQRLGWVREATVRPGGDDAIGGEVESDDGRSTEGMQYFAPDARTLLADAFVEAHCLRVVEAPRDVPARAGQVGLAFEPLRLGGLPDVRGTLWVDRATRELRALEFRYTGLRRFAERFEPGGEVYFARRADGRWYIERWLLRMPIVLQRTLEGIREVGGRTLLDGELPVVPPGVALVRGVLVDSTQDLAPVPNARVRVVGTPYVAVTNAFGTFRLELPAAAFPRGAVAALAIDHPRVVALGVPATGAVAVVPGREAVTVAAFPSVATVRRALCGAAADSAQGVITGAVWGERLSRIQRGLADVRAPQRDYLVDVNVGDSTVGAPESGRGPYSVRTDRNGHFHRCGLPGNGTVRLRLVPFQHDIDRRLWPSFLAPLPARSLVVLELVRGEAAAYLRQEGPAVGAGAPPIGRAAAVP